jgi:hypothetical protein
LETLKWLPVETMTHKNFWRHEIKAFYLTPKGKATKASQAYRVPQIASFDPFYNGVYLPKNLWINVVK